MKIEKVKKEVIKRFADLRIGEAFMLKDCFSTDICIKTYTFICEDFSDLNDEWDGEETYNAFMLRTGDPFWCNDLAEVIVPNCKVVVE